MDLDVIEGLVMDHVVDRDSLVLQKVGGCPFPSRKVDDDVLFQLQRLFVASLGVLHDVSRIGRGGQFEPNPLLGFWGAKQHQIEGTPLSSFERTLDEHFQDFVQNQRLITRDISLW